MLECTGTSTLYQTDSILKQPSGPVLAWFESESQERDVEILAEERPARPTMLELPKDRPFANLTSTSMLPMNYASIFQAHVDPKEKARRLKLALRRDNLQLMAYFLMLGSLGSLAFFQAAKGEQPLSVWLLHTALRRTLISIADDLPLGHRP